MRKIKTQKGITLVALILTIVVLLILAVVAISSVQNDGIINYAKNAATSYNQAQTNEATLIENYDQYINNHIGVGGVAVCEEHEWGTKNYGLPAMKIEPDGSVTSVYQQVGTGICKNCGAKCQHTNLGNQYYYPVDYRSENWREEHEVWVNCEECGVKDVYVGTEAHTNGTWNEDDNRTCGKCDIS